jgi:hypothetical protein
MAKRKKANRRTPEEQRAYDERTKLIEEILAERWAALKQSRVHRG